MDVERVIMCAGFVNAGGCYPNKSYMSYLNYIKTLGHKRPYPQSVSNQALHHSTDCKLQDSLKSVGIPIPILNIRYNYHISFSFSCID